jgi:lysozyme family protein
MNCPIVKQVRRSKMPIEYKDALNFVLKWEGGYTNHPKDPGGATNKGITQKVYDEYRLSKKHPLVNVKHILDYEVNEIYETRYWNLVRAKWLKASLGLVMFDTAVNFGPNGAIRRLQKALQLKITGTWTQEISEIIHVCDAGKVALEICKLRKIWRNYRVKQNPTQKVFLKGWLNRDNDLINEVNKLLGAQILSSELEVFDSENSEIEYDENELIEISKEDFDEHRKFENIEIID